MQIRKYLIVFLFLILASHAQGQSLSGSVLLASPELGLGARTTAMGGAGIATANDYSALEWNPAALTLIPSAELDLSLFYLGHKSDAQFLGSTSSEDISATSFNSFGWASAVPTTRGHLAFAISIDHNRDYTTTYSFSAVNPNSSFFDTRNFAYFDTRGFVNENGPVKDGSFSDYIASLQSYNLAWQLYLTNGIADTTNPKLTTPFSKGGMLESGTVTTTGGQYAVRLGMGIDIAKNISFGATLNYYNGMYDYDRAYTETDVNNVFSRTDSNPPAGFKSATIYDHEHETQNGFGLKLGLLGSAGKFLSFGITAETPTWYSIDDRFVRSGNSQFNFQNFSSFGDSLLPDVIVTLNQPITNSYTLMTPWKFGAGAAVSLLGLTVSAQANYSDFSTIRYSNADVDLSDLNTAAKDQLRGVLSLRLGGEFIIKPLGLILRAGYGLDPSPYKNDPSSFNTQSLSGGLGLLLGPSAIIEATYRRVSYRTDHLVYGGLNIAGTDVTTLVNADDIVQNQVLLSLSFRW